MLKEALKRQYPELINKLVTSDSWQRMDDRSFSGLSIAIHELLHKSFPDDPEPIERLGEAYHYRKQLYEAGEYYTKALAMDPPQSLSEAEIDRVYRYAPILRTNPQEYFKLMDVIAIHHPDKPLIAYHLFWEDDFNFPDDFDPCDHEQIWVSYNPESGQVDGVWSFFHSYVLTTPEAVEEANSNQGHPIIRVQWGIHGSLVHHWESLQVSEIGLTLPEFIKNTYADAIKGGRMSEHPIKQRWPQRFEGSFEDYLDFSQEVRTEDFLRSKKMLIKARWANAVIQQHFLAYNFAPKYDWPL